MATSGIDVRVENQLVRFVPTSPVNPDSVVTQLDGQKNGHVVVKALDKPRATIIIDEQGRIIVHGTNRVEVARAAARELLLRLGLDDSGLQTELGPVIASFAFDNHVKISEMNMQFSGGVSHFDKRLECAVINDTRHNLKLHVWSNGKCIASDARHPNMVAMSAVFWKGKFEEHKLFL